MTTRSGPGDRARENGPENRNVLGMVGRFVLTLTNKALWRIVGGLLLDGSKHTRDAEVFSGIGFYARPGTGGRPEALVVFPGGAGAPIIVAARDEATRQAVANDLAAGDAMVYSPAACVHVKADGTVEVRTPGGVAVRLLTMHDGDVLRAATTTAVIALGAGGASTIFAAADAIYAGEGSFEPWPNGTSVLKGE